MAVQAQYPCNVLFLNRAGEEQTDDYSLQPQPPGGDQSHIFFHNNNNNSAFKRESVGNSRCEATATNGVDQQQQFSTQNQQNPLISTGLRLSFPDQNQSLLLSQQFSSQFKRQRHELDQFLHSQGEQLRRTLAEKRHRHYRALLGVAEEAFAAKLRDKDAELEKARRKNADLEARAAQLSAEARVWQEKARVQEATASALQLQLQQHAMMSPAQDSKQGEAEDGESAYVDPERVVGPRCKGCRRRIATVVLLPCRHLCVCEECDRLLQICPLCHVGRTSSVEVFFS